MALVTIHNVPSAGLNVADTVYFKPPASLTSLRGLYVFGGFKQATSTPNLAGGPPLTVVGSPTIKRYSALLSQSNYFETGLARGPESTWIVVVKRQNTGGAIMGDDNVTDGAYLGIDNTGPLTQLLARIRTSPSSLTVAGSTKVGEDTSTFEFFALTLSTSAGRSVLYWPRLNQISQRAYAGPPVELTKTTRIGSLPNPSAFDDVNNGAIEIAMAMECTAAMSSGRILDTYAKAQIYYDKRSIIL